jgi:hypothetical protein
VFGGFNIWQHFQAVEHLWTGSFATNKGILHLKQQVMAE